jgi:hypothetical protein
VSGGCSSFRDCTTGRCDGSVSHTLRLEWLSANNGRLLKLYEKHLPAASNDGETEVELNNDHPDKGTGSISAYQS